MQWGSFDKEQQTATHTHTHWTSFRSHGKWRINYPSLASIAFPSSEIFDKWHCETFLWFFRSQFWSHDLMPLSFLSYALNYPNRISHGKWFCFTEKVNRNNAENCMCCMYRYVQYSFNAVDVVCTYHLPASYFYPPTSTLIIRSSFNRSEASAIS